MEDTLFLKDRIKISPYLIPGLPEINSKRINLMVCQYFGIMENDLLKRSRRIEFVLPRQIAMYLIKKETGRSNRLIGEDFRDRDSSTVTHAINKVNGYLDVNDKYVSVAISTLRKEIRNRLVWHNKN